MSDETRQVMKSRDQMKRRTVKSKDLDSCNCYKSLRNKTTRLIELAKRDYYNDLLTHNADDSSKLWSTLKKLLPNKRNIAVQDLVIDGASENDNLGIANGFNTFFTSVGSQSRQFMTVLHGNS